MQPERMWKGGLLTAAVRIGLLPGIALGLLRFALDGSVPRAVFQGAFFTLAWGSSMVVVLRRGWAKSSELAPHDRVAVARAVYRGEDIGDDHLAPAVIDYADVVRRAQARDDRMSWAFYLLAGLALMLAIEATVNGPGREAFVYWLLAVAWVLSLKWWLPRRRARSAENARKADLAARRRLHGS
jgi:hypothetical protein